MEKIDIISNQNSRQNSYSNLTNRQNKKKICQDDISPAGENLISSSVKNVNSYYLKFKTENNDSAQKGLDVVTSTFADDTESLTSFILASEELKTTDEESFNNLFNIIGQMKEKGLNAQKWLKIFNSLDSIELKRQFIISSSRLINEEADPGELEELYNNFLNKVNSVRFDKNLTKSQKNVSLESYFTSIITFQGPLSQSGMQKILTEAVNKQISG